MSDSDPHKWDRPPHTEAKHQLLRRYLGGWYPIMASFSGRMVYLDGFAGRGRYTDGAEGSPQIALRHLLDHDYFPRMRHREFVFLFVEANANNAACLQEEIRRLRNEYVPWPTNVKVAVVNETFEVTATDMLETLREQKRRLAPTFAFVDPFGYTGLSMDLLAELLDYPRTELFVNFMVDPVQRFIERGGQEETMRSLFGLDVADVLADFDGRDRVAHLRDVYWRQLQLRAGFDYVQSFAMLNKMGKISYCLFHGTRHRKGVRLMKDAMWAIDPGGGYRFSDRLAGQDILFGMQPDLGPLRAELLRHYAGRADVSADEIEWHIVLNTPYRSTHVRPVLRELEEEGQIQVHRPPGKRQFSPGVTIAFP